MTTALAVTSHGHMLSPPDRHTPRAHLLKPPGEQPLETALEEIHTLLEQHGYLVVLYPASLPTAFRHRLHTLRALLESDRIALLDTGLPPLGTGVLVRQLRQLSLCDFSPGVLAAAARLLAHYIHAGAVLNSVAKLDRIPVSLTAHAKSWMPGAQFAVLAAPTPRLIRLGGSGADTAGKRGGGLPAPEYGTRLTVAPGAVGADWVTQTLAPQWGAAEVQEAHPPEDSARWWGTAKLTEFAAAIPDLSVLYQLVASVRRDECHWCGLELIGDRCAFCSAPVPPGPPVARPGAARGARRTGHPPTAMAAPPVEPVPAPMPRPPEPAQPPEAPPVPPQAQSQPPSQPQPPAQPQPPPQPQPQHPQYPPNTAVIVHQGDPRP